MSRKKKITRIEPFGACPPVKYRALNSCCLPSATSSCLCDCCVIPLQSVLKQLNGQTVIICTVADTPNVTPLIFLYEVVAVNDFLVTVTGVAGTFTINISDVIGVGFLPPGPTINLLPPVTSGGECDCRERPIRQLLDTLINSTTNLLTINGSVSVNFNVEQTGLGIVLGTLLIDPGNPDSVTRFAISTCKITAVGQLN